MTNRPPLPILIVDDSAVARQALKAIVEVDRGFRALLASDPYEAVEVMKRTVPAAILLDVNMPRMDGLTFLRKLMRQHPLPVLLCTDHPQKALEGLEIGATRGDPQAALGGSFGAGRLGRAAPREPPPGHRRRGEAARGPGPDPMDAVPRLATHSPDRRRRRPPAAEAAASGTPAGSRPDHRRRSQHRGRSGHHPAARGLPQATHPGSWSSSICRPGSPRRWPNGSTATRRSPWRSPRPVTAQPVRRGRALIVPGGDLHGVVRRVGRSYRVELVDGPPVSRFRPSVDVLFRSTAQAAGDRAVGVILTGMLDDGARGLLEMSEAGSWTIAQDRATSTVFGMNAEAIRLGAARQVLPLDRIAEAALAGGC